MNLADTYLLDRGVTPQTVAQHGIEIDLGPLNEGRIISRLAQGCVPVWKLARELLWFPVRKASGAVMSWIARPLPTLTGGPKFVTPVGGIAPPFVPKRVYGLSAGEPLVVTEGPVKALVCDQAGVAAIGINGVWCASAKLPNDKLVLRQEIHGLDVRGRKVYIAFDADSAIKADVRHAMIRLFFMLSAAGAEVYQLTSWDISEGKGIDDYLVGQTSQGTPEACLKMLITDAVPKIGSQSLNPQTVKLAPLRNFVDSSLFVRGIGSQSWSAYRSCRPPQFRRLDTCGS